MKRKYCAVLLGLAVTAALTGCGSDNKDADKNTDTETEFSTAAPAESAEEDVDMDDFGMEDETEIPLEPITPSDYLVENASDYVSIDSYEGLSVTQYVYEITDEMLQEMIDSDLQLNSIETEVERASAAGDVIYVDMTYTVQGSEDSTTENTYFQLGAEEYGADFDEALTGLSAGDSKNFSITFDEFAFMEEWVDATVDFEVSVTSVCEVTLPEYNDAYVQEYCGYDTVAEYEKAMREYVTSEYNDISYSDTLDALFEAAAERASFTGYPQELYDSCKEEILSFYMDYTDSSDVSDVYDLFGLSEEDLDAEILDTVNRRLLVSKLCQDNGIEITDDDYSSYVEECAEYYGYDSAASFEADYGRTSLVWLLYESRAGEILYASADITEAPYEEEYIEDAELIEEDVDISDEPATDVSEETEPASES